MSKDSKGALILVVGIVVFVIFITPVFLATKRAHLNEKTKIKQELYLRDKEHYQDEYVDLWFDLHYNKYFNDINWSRSVHTDEEGITKLEKMNNTIDKLIDIYGKNFHTLIPQYPLNEVYLNEDKEYCIFDTNTLSYLKLKCEEAINTNKKYLESKREREALNNKIVYGKDK